MTKILMIGTGHVYRIADSVSFLIRKFWPSAVLVELDQTRLDLMNGKKVDRPDMPKSYARSAKYQEKMSTKNNSETGGELMAAVNTANIVGAEVICIDKDAITTMKELEAERSLGEKIRYAWSTYTDNLFGKKKDDRTRQSFVADEEEFLTAMRRKYPVFVRKLIDERDEYMAAKIREAAPRYGAIVIVVGDAHVEGICRLVPELDIYKVRLADLLDADRLEKVKDAVWNDTIGRGTD